MLWDVGVCMSMFFICGCVGCRGVYEYIFYFMGVCMLCDVGAYKYVFYVWVCIYIVMCVHEHVFLCIGAHILYEWGV